LGKEGGSVFPTQPGGATRKSILPLKEDLWRTRTRRKSGKTQFKCACDIHNEKRDVEDRSDDGDKKWKGKKALGDRRQLKRKEKKRPPKNQQGKTLGRERQCIKKKQCDQVGTPKAQHEAKKRKPAHIRHQLGNSNQGGRRRASKTRRGVRVGRAKLIAVRRGKREAKGVLEGKVMLEVAVAGEGKKLRGGSSLNEDESRKGEEVSDRGRCVGWKKNLAFQISGAGGGTSSSQRNTVKEKSGSARRQGLKGRKSHSQEETKKIKGIGYLPVPCGMPNYNQKGGGWDTMR